MSKIEEIRPPIKKKKFEEICPNKTVFMLELLLRNSCESEILRYDQFY